MPALLYTADLACSSKVSGAAARAGVDLTVAMSVAALLEKAGALNPELVILDLAAPGIVPGELIGQLKALASAPRVIAFGPHVHEAKLAAAAEAGCDAVLARGQFYAQLESLLK
ncbi:MAG TPA: hypothetical protein VHC19_05275 [Pirellulales bacterium]|nr:hypothetical protein [Pirellulales bacterium]